MGRSGGGGGGGHSGGGFSGGRSSGGFSGGGGRSGGSHSSDGGSWYRGFRPSHTNIFIGGPSYYGGYSGGCSYIPDDRVFRRVLIILVVLIIGIGLYLSSCSHQPSSVVRIPLAADDVNVTAYYDDRDGSWVTNGSCMEAGMREFFEETGVQPYVVILPNGTITSSDILATMAKDEYEKFFTDEGHFLLIFCDDGDGSFNCGWTAGTAATRIMDDEAVDILSDELNYSYEFADTDEEVFSDAFAATADRIMAAYHGETRDNTVFYVVIITVAAVGSVLLIRYVIKKRREKIEREAKRREDILNTPLEELVDDELNDKADDYDPILNDPIRRE